MKVVGILARGGEWHSGTGTRERSHLVVQILRLMDIMRGEVKPHKLALSSTKLTSQGVDRSYHVYVLAPSRLWKGHVRFKCTRLHALLRALCPKAHLHRLRILVL